MSVGNNKVEQSATPASKEDYRFFSRPRHRSSDYIEYMEPLAKREIEVEF
jgi:hypothetical protein